MRVLQNLGSIPRDDSEVSLKSVWLGMEVEEVAFFIEEASVFVGMFGVSHEE